jgi:hypothetical protein
MQDNPEHISIMGREGAANAMLHSTAMWANVYDRGRGRRSQRQMAEGMQQLNAGLQGQIDQQQLARRGVDEELSDD